MQQRRVFIVIAVLSILLLSASAQIPGYKEYRLEDNNTKIFSLYKSKQGYILTGTSTGLFKFNGLSFEKIETNQPNLADTITAIFQDNKNSIWVGCNSGRIATIQKGKLQYAEPEEGTPKKSITCFAQDAKGEIWFGTAGEGVYYFSGKKLYLINEENGLSDLNIHALALASNGDMIAATDQGINICSGNGNKKTVKEVGPAQGLPDYIVTAISTAGNDNFWIGLQDKGFCLYNHASKKIAVPEVVANWDKGQVNGLYFTHNNVWISTQDSGLVCYSAAKQQLLTAATISIPQKTITNIVEDNQGDMWMVAANNSLIKTSGNTLLLHQLFNANFAATVHTILVDNESNFWAGTDMALVKYVYNGRNYTTKKYPIAGLGITTDITSLYQDKYSNIWIGTMGKGIFVLDAATGKSRQVIEAFANSSILSITGNGNIVCTAGLEGAVVFELSAANSTIANNYIFTYYNKIETIGSTYIYNVFKDSKGRIWFATDGKGLTMLSNGVYTHYNKTSGIKDEHIYSVTEDKIGKIWFSTSNAGLYSFDGKNFVNYALKEGLSNLQVSAIKTDKQGNIVAIHKTGIDIIDTKNGRVSYINAAQGIEGINDGLGASCTNAAGDIFIATQKGILQFNALTGANNYPATVIENVQLFLNDIDTASLHYFKYDENNIRFNFTGLYYSDPAHIFFEYKLEGLYNAWQLTKDNSRAFPKLPPGKYVFKVRSSLNKNFNNASEAAFAFEIAKPFWRTWWFIAAIVLAIASLLFWIIKAREKRLTHVQQLQNEKVKFEFEVLRNQVNPHFLFNSFNTLISTIEDNPKAGVEYVEQLSDFFRNIVNYRDKDTITLQEELSLLQNYLYMQQKRYGNSLQLTINVKEPEQQQIYLPPLTLQLLMENAIKHNVVSKEALLKVDIHIENVCLIVQNNINKKLNKEKGTGMGLENIKNRYALLHETPVQIDDNGKDFIVRLPILKN